MRVLSSMRMGLIGWVIGTAVLLGIVRDSGAADDPGKLFVAPDVLLMARSEVEQQMRRELVCAFEASCVSSKPAAPKPPDISRVCSLTRTCPGPGSSPASKFMTALHNATSAPTAALATIECLCGAAVYDKTSSKWNPEGVTRIKNHMRLLEGVGAGATVLGEMDGLPFGLATSPLSELHVGMTVSFADTGGIAVFDSQHSTLLPMYQSLLDLRAQIRRNSGVPGFNASASLEASDCAILRNKRTGGAQQAEYVYSTCVMFKERLAYFLQRWVSDEVRARRKDAIRAYVVAPFSSY